jgi:hypothetical protein
MTRVRKYSIVAEVKGTDRVHPKLKARDPFGVAYGVGFLSCPRQS